MPWQVRVDLSHSLALEHCQRGNTIFLEGDPGDKMYIVLSGKVGISIKSKSIKDLGPGEQFGEVALLKKGATRAATVTALEAGAYTRSHFRSTRADLAPFRST
jgi:CRP-like cAMP-binding protein